MPESALRQNLNPEPRTLNPMSVVVATVLCLVVAASVQAQLFNPLSKPAAAWQPSQVEEVRAQAFAWLDAKKADAAARAKAEAIWSDLPSSATEEDLLVRLAQTFALADPNAAKLVTLCSKPRSQLVVPDQPWLRDGGAPPLFVNNLRLFFARWLVYESLFDEALEQLAGLAPNEVVAPASLLFYRSAACHALLNKEVGLRSMTELLRGAEASPRRYVVLSQLMQGDLKGLKEDTLDHVARRMNDIRRRLDLGRAGPKVRQVEDGVIESLDEIIKKLEEQQGAGGGSGIFSMKPMEDSQLAGGQGPGKVTRKHTGYESGWGDLPPKEREEAMQQIGRDFPSNYRDLIEQYFRRIAAEGSK